LKRKPVSFYIVATFMVVWPLHGKAPTNLRSRAIKLSINSVETLAITTSALREAIALGIDRGGIVPNDQR
jgi:hypothetical protein